MSQTITDSDYEGINCLRTILSAGASGNVNTNIHVFLRKLTICCTHSGVSGSRSQGGQRWWQLEVLDQRNMHIQYQPCTVYIHKLQAVKFADRVRQTSNNVPLASHSVGKIKFECGRFKCSESRCTSLQIYYCFTACLTYMYLTREHRYRT